MDNYPAIWPGFFIINTCIMQYFNNCQTIDEVKSLYKTLAKKFHPDLGGDTAIMQAINTEYAFATAKLLKGENLSSEELSDKIKDVEAYRKVIEALLLIEGINIEIVGNWLWVTGNTYPVKDKIHAAGCFWAKNKKVWYFRTDEFKTKGGKKSLDEIRAKYGSVPVNGNHNNKVLK